MKWWEARPVLEEMRIAATNNTISSDQWLSLESAVVEWAYKAVQSDPSQLNILLESLRRRPALTNWAKGRNEFAWPTALEQQQPSVLSSAAARVKGDIASDDEEKEEGDDEDFVFSFDTPPEDDQELETK